MRSLSLEIPPEPALRILLESFHLCFYIHPHVRLHRPIPQTNIVLVRARPVWPIRGGSGGRPRAIVSYTDTVAIQVRGAVCHSSSPFANESPFISTPVAGGCAANRLEMLLWRQSLFLWGEDLIVVVICSF